MAALLVAASVFLGTQGQAQEAAVAPLDLSESGEAYLRAKGRGINSDVAYYDPTRAAPAFETDQQPRARRQDRDRGVSGERVWTTTRISTALITGVILAVMVYLFLQFGPRMTVSLRSTSENAERDPRGRQRRDAAAGEMAEIQPLRSILNMSDRSMAIVLLARALLAHVVEANGILIQKSWTAREALRRLPASQPHLSALNALVLASERVQFGNRQVDEETFDAHVKEVSPLVQGALQ